MDIRYAVRSLVKNPGFAVVIGALSGYVLGTWGEVEGYFRHPVLLRRHRKTRVVHTD